MPLLGRTLLWCCLVLVLPQWSLAAPDAVLVVETDSGTPAILSLEVLDPVRQQVSRRWRLRSFQDLPGLLEREPLCDLGNRRKEARRVLGEIEQALAAFYQQIRPDEAREHLRTTLEEVRTLPCVVPEDSLREPLTEAGLLLVRLLLMDGRPESASEVARDLLQWQEVPGLPLDHVPPEVRDFLGRTVRDREGSLVSMPAPDLPSGWTLLVDGFPLPGDRQWKVSAGGHRVDLLGPEEAFRGSVEVTKGSSWRVFEDLSRAFQPGPGGTLWATSADASEWDRRLAQAFTVDVLRLRANPDARTCRVDVTASSQGLPQQEVLWVDLRELPRNRLSMVRKGVLVQRVPWYWAPIAGALSLGLVATGIALNVQANHTMDAIVGGEDRLGTWRAQRQGSVTSYALGAALGITAAALTWAGHGMPSRTALSVSGPSGVGASSAPVSEAVSGGIRVMR